MAKTIPVSQGGRLMPAFSLENIGLYNWVEKLNLRRDGDVERKREGWSAFHPNGAIPGVQSQPGAGVIFVGELVRPNGDRAIIAASKTTIWRFVYSTGSWEVIGSGFSNLTKRWQACSTNGYLVLNNAVDLPVTFRVEDGAVVPMYELRDLGVASVAHIEEVNGILILANIKWIKSTDLITWMGSTPYLTPPDEICDVRPFEWVWSEIGQPRNYAPAFTATMPSAGAVITLPWATQSLATGDKVAVVNGGPNGGILGGQTGIEDGVSITVAGTTLTLGTPTDAGLTYPRKVQILRWTDQSTIVGKRSIQGDGSPIIALKKLGKQAIFYRSTGIYTARFTGSIDAPWAVTERYTGPNVPRFFGAVANSNDEFHIYPAVGGSPEESGHFYAFNGLEPPSIHSPMDSALPIWDAGLDDAAPIWVLENPATREIWFCKTGAVLALDTVTDSVGIIDATIHAGAYVMVPGTNARAFILFDGTDICRYGGTFLRKGLPSIARLKSGLYSFGDDINEKTMVEYTPSLASSSPEVALQVKIYSAWSPGATPELLFTEDLNYSQHDSMVYMHYESIFFQDEVVVVDTRDVDVKISARTININGAVQSRGSQRNKS